MSHRKSLAVIGLIGILAPIDAAFGATYMDWCDHHVIGRVVWTLTGSNITSREITSAFPNNNWSAFCGYQGLSWGGDNFSRATLDVNIQDNTANGCSSVTVEMHGAHMSTASYCINYPSTGVVFESKTWNTCINNLNVDTYTSRWWGRGTENPIVVSAPETGQSWAGQNAYEWHIWVTDNWGSAHRTACYVNVYDP